AGRAEVARIRPLAQVGLKSLDQFSVRARATLALAGVAEMDQPLLNLPGPGNRRDQVPVDTVRPVGFRAGVPPLQHVVIVAPVQPDLLRSRNPVWKLGDPLQAMPFAVAPGPGGPRAVLLTVHARDALKQPRTAALVSCRGLGRFVS